ncbi:MAG TPA: tellurite resistance TerB family protein [Hyphomicrobiales bacterium]|nr:tellurite resistance TerB family protein [Rhodobiaceae bacterium]HXK54782.1 tellurite resistance TerB family protein [Hyphomicrobiales bacterium]
MSQTVPVQSALIYVMVTMSAVDSSMNDAELRKIGNIVANLPAFKGFDQNRLVSEAEACGEIVSRDGGLKHVLDLIANSLPAKLHETAYALAVEVAAADLAVGQEELRFLQLLRDRLNLEKLVVAAIERGARARHTTA